jgi:hypothetical protein
LIQNGLGRITGTIPGMFCGYGASSMNMLYREFGCDAVLCRPGTFNIHGHATLHSACRPCPVQSNYDDTNTSNLSEETDHAILDYSSVLGRTRCETAKFVHGDLDGDGILSPREVLRLLYVDTLGRFWGNSFQTWADMSVHECKLVGVTCTEDEVSRIDLSNAEMCSNGEKRPGPKQYCKGIPAEIGELSSLEVLQMNRRVFLRGTLPTEIGKLTMLRVLDVSGCSLLSGTIPTEIGNMTDLRRAMLSNCRFMGTIPSTISSLPKLEKFYVTNNLLVGSIPTEIGNMKNLKEFMISRNMLTGSFPRQVGRMAKLENFEAYLNFFVGRIPEELAVPTIKRIGKFSKKPKGMIQKDEDLTL